MLASLYHKCSPLNALLVYLIDHTLIAWFTPKWRKQGNLVLKALSRYINFHSDVMPAETLEEFQCGRNELRAALRTWDKEQTEKLSARWESTLKSTPGGILSGLAENVEVLFVIIAIFLGLRCYILQPFRIPTGSMQPSLNGIRSIDQSGEEATFAEKVGAMIVYGGSYNREIANQTKKIVKFRQKTEWKLFTVTEVLFNDGSTIKIPAAEAETQRYFLNRKASIPSEQHTPFRTFKAGEEIVNARFDAGDLIIVNKMAYHFRKPERGEVFVFDTRGISGISAGTGTGQEGGTHYVKRLCGLPTDTISIANKHLIVNGEQAKEPTLQRVAAGKAPYQDCGYIAMPAPRHLLDTRYYLTEGNSVLLKKDKTKPWLNEYLALGDNSTRQNSFDSRYWGPVHQYNIVGPASFCLWPFTEHWGIIP
ncbi:MAG: signal peptidase I [Akkermansia sp.]|nr:signal peptidase I [Akkermansia sp.]